MKMFIQRPSAVAAAAIVVGILSSSSSVVLGSNDCGGRYQPACEKDVNSPPVSPSPTGFPSIAPTAPPTLAPTIAASQSPSGKTTNSPSSSPSHRPTMLPTPAPSSAPPTQEPTIATSVPSIQTRAPTTLEETPVPSSTEEEMTEMPSSTPSVDVQTGVPSQPPSSESDRTQSPSNVDSPTLAPITLATAEPTDASSCTSSNGVFGIVDSTTTSVVIEFGYELETSFDQNAAQNTLLPLLEEAFVDGILPDAVPSSCGRRLRVTRKLEVIGVSKNPTDEFVDDVNCEPSQMLDGDNSNCFVVSGALTLHTDGANTDEVVELVQSGLQRNMDDGTFAASHESIVRVSYVQLDPSSSGSNRGDGVTTGRSGEDSPNSIRYGIFGAVAGAVTLLVSAILYSRRRRQLSEDSDADTGFSGNNAGEDVNPNPSFESSSMA